MNDYNELSGLATCLAIDVYSEWSEPTVMGHLEHDGHRWLPGELPFILRHFESSKWSSDEEIIAARQELIAAGLIVFGRIDSRGWWLRPTPALVEWQARLQDEVEAEQIEGEANDGE